MASLSDAIRFPNVIGWFGVGGHEFWLVAGEMGVVRPLRRTELARWYGSVTPSICSTNARLMQVGLSQKNRRTFSRTNTSLPVMGRSSSCRP
jgi:hypothetical protein